MQVYGGTFHWRVSQKNLLHFSSFCELQKSSSRSRGSFTLVHQDKWCQGFFRSPFLFTSVVGMVTEIAVSPHNCPDRELSDLEYADDVLLNKHIYRPPFPLSCPNNRVDAFWMSFTSSQFKMLLQNWIDSKQETFPVA